MKRGGREVDARPPFSGVLEVEMPALAISAEVTAALASGRPVVALESTLIAHGLPWPVNLETAREAESTVRSAGAVPATIAVRHGRPTIGLTGAEIEELARSREVFKAGRRDLGAAIGLNRLAATTVSATMALAHAAGIHVFATGGIGGVHRECAFDVSADLTELARTPVLVVSAGAKSILDLPRTLEMLETLGVPVIGYRTDEFPAFTVASSGLPVSCCVESPAEAAAVFRAHVELGGAGAILAQNCPPDAAVPSEEFARWHSVAEADARAARVTGPAVTPFLLARIAELSGGRTLVANRALVIANARLAAEVAAALGTDGR